MTRYGGINAAFDNSVKDWLAMNSNCLSFRENKLAKPFLLWHVTENSLEPLPLLTL